MSQPEEIDSFYGLAEEMKEMSQKIANLQSRVHARLLNNSEWESTYHISMIQESQKIQRTVKSLCDDLLNNQFSEPSVAAIHLWSIIELYSSSLDAVTEGTRVLERLFKIKMRSMIKPENYLTTIVDYVRWQNETVRCFSEQYMQKSRCTELERIERLWNWNLRANEGIYFGGAARPLHLKKVTDFAATMSIFYDRLWPIFKTNRNALANALNTLLREESSKYWRNYQIFPCVSSNAIIDKCLQYFYFKNRQNTWFINSSLSDYIPFISSAREIFGDKFDGSNMQLPDQHDTEWILNNLRERCLKIRNRQNDSTDPIIIILLTSKNRFGDRIDVDRIHSQITEEFSIVITIVDGCQDGQAFEQVDIIIYSKRFSTTGAICLINETFLSKHSLLTRKLTFGITIPVTILAQVYITLNMINTQLTHGVEDLVNSCRWQFCPCPVQAELESVFQRSHIYSTKTEYVRGPIRYSFTEDLTTGTIITLTTTSDADISLTKLWALLRKEGHSLDCFVMDNVYLDSNRKINFDTIRELIERKAIEELRQIEVLSSDYLACPLVPYWVSSSDDISVDDLDQHFQKCDVYHRCLRISIGRCGYLGRLKRFVERVDSIIKNNELIITDNNLGKHSSQWPS